MEKNVATMMVGVYSTEIISGGVVVARFFHDNAEKEAIAWLENNGMEYSRKWIGPNVYSRTAVEEYVGLRR